MIAISYPKVSIYQYLSVIYFLVSNKSNTRMDKSELRRKQLKALTDALGWGGIALVAKHIGKEPSYVSRMLYEPTKAGKKRITEDSADLIEAAFPGWMDDAIAAAKAKHSPVQVDDRSGIEPSVEKITSIHKTELLRRMESAPPETLKLIELALMPEADIEETNLSPSLKNLIGFVKHQIREEIQNAGRTQ